MIVNAAAAAEGAARGEAWERLLDPATTLAGPWRSSFAVSFVAPRVALACDEREVKLTAHGFPVRRKKGREGIAIVVLLADSAGCEGREVLAAASLPEARAAARKQRQRRREWNARRRSAETEGGDVEGREALYYASDSDDGHVDDESSSADPSAHAAWRARRAEAAAKAAASTQLERDALLVVADANAWIGRYGGNALREPMNELGVELLAGRFHAGGGSNSASVDSSTVARLELVGIAALAEARRQVDAGEAATMADAHRAVALEIEAGSDYALSATTPPRGGESSSWLTRLVAGGSGASRVVKDFTCLVGSGYLPATSPAAPITAWRAADDRGDCFTAWLDVKELLLSLDVAQFAMVTDEIAPTIVRLQFYCLFTTIVFPYPSFKIFLSYGIFDCNVTFM